MKRNLLRITEILSLPLLFAFYAVTFLAAHNINEINLQDTGRTFVVVALAIPMTVFLIWLIIRDGYRSAFIAFMAVVLFFSYGHLRAFMKSIEYLAPFLGRHRYLVILFASIFIAWSWFVVKRLGTAQSWVRRISIIGLAVLILPTLTIAASFIPGKWEALQADAADQEERAISVAPMPDIYYIILDGYGRKDVLEELYGFDNSEFLTALMDKGFYVAEESLSNYNTTRLSLASSLNLDYLQTIIEAEDIGLNPGTAEEMMWDNTVFKYLNQFGFETVAFETGRPWSSISSVDHYLEAGEDQTVNALMPRTTLFNEFETMLIKSTALSLLLDGTKVFKTFERSQSVMSNEEHRIRVIYGLQKIKEIPEWRGNYYVFLHVLSPHPPFIFSASGERVDHDRPFTFGDASNFMQIASRDEYIDGYIEQLQYINKLTLDAVEEILAESNPPPVIIIQGDHGPGAYLDWQSREDSNLKERHAILNAYFLPEEGARNLYPSISPVNTFRVIFNVFFNGKFELLEDRAFFTEKNSGYELIDVTSEVK